MFHIKEPSSIEGDWILSDPDVKEIVSIPHKILQILKNYHIMGVEFLYHNYRRGFKGSIINEEYEMNFPLQIAAFLGAVLKKGKVLIICPDDKLCLWHYYIRNFNDFEVDKVHSKDFFEKFKDSKLPLVKILNFEHLNLIEDFNNVTFDFLIIDTLDCVAKKHIIKKLKSKFNIGFTTRNFYMEPDQKLQWTMLNWSNPGTFGKLKDFYKIDNYNFKHLRDSYRFWWFRLTFEFCSSFQRPTPEEINELQETIREWGKIHDFVIELKSKPSKRKVNRNDQKEEATKLKRSKKIGKPNKKPLKVDTNGNQNTEQSREVLPKEIIDENEEVTETETKDTTKSKMEENPKYVELPSMDENPILTSIIKNFSLPPTTEYSSFQHHNSKSDDENDVLLSIINSKPRISKSDFIHFNKTSNSGNPRESSNELRIEDVDKLLKETDTLLGK